MGDHLGARVVATTLVRVPNLCQSVTLTRR